MLACGNMKCNEYSSRVLIVELSCGIHTQIESIIAKHNRLSFSLSITGVLRNSLVLKLQKKNVNSFNMLKGQNQLINIPHSPLQTFLLYVKLTSKTEKGFNCTILVLIMLCFCILSIFTILYIIYDVNYWIRTVLTVLSGRLYQNKCSLMDITTIYGMCTFQDCDLNFKGIRLARLLREIDFGRYHFYDRTGIYERSQRLGIKSLQGSTLTLYEEIVPLFVPYKINTKLVYWDERSLFLEHEVITLRDDKVRCLIVSRQYAIGKKEETTKDLLKDLSGSNKPECPNYICHWIQSMQVSSKQMRTSLDIMPK